MSETPATRPARHGSQAGAAPLPARPSGAADAGPDRYVLDREIGGGGMGRVFAGRDLRLQREVAIKTLRDPHTHGMARFEREALLSARLQHPGIVPVHDVGRWASGEPFLVMRLVHGRSLLRVIEDAETIAERLALLPTLIAVADAMAYAHDRGIVHRDLKPSNILVGAFGDVAIVDWGLAKDVRVVGESPADASLPGGVSPAAHSNQGLTEQGAVMGTPAYMAPEQARGAEVDARADVFALGAILYKLLSGLAPGSVTDDASATPAVASQRPTPLPALVPGLPADLLAVVARALAENPRDRYDSAFELAEDLRRFHAGRPVNARRQFAMVRGARWLARRPLQLLWLAVTALLIARACR